MISYEEATSRCWAEVDLNKLVSNYQNAKKHLDPSTQLICVLKANAYGVGAVAVAKRLWQEGQRFFAVASFNEATELRRDIPECEVLILGLCSKDQLKKAVKDRLLITVFSEKYLQEVNDAAFCVGAKARVHLKLETGLNRIGFASSDIILSALRKHSLELMHVEGLFTHLALRDTESDHRQLEKLIECKSCLERNGVTVPMVHALDSIGMVRYPDMHMDAVRIGAWLYGVYPKGYEHPEESQLCMTVKTRIAQIHWVAKECCLGYDETHPLQKDSMIATLSTGYIDGYPRQNSVGEVEICGKRAPVVGLVCMDQMMVDISDIPEAYEGAEVTLLGGSIGVDEYAAWGKLNRNESLARTGRRVPRVYYEDGIVKEIVDELA